MDTTRELTAEELRDLETYWRAANYLAAGQIYLMSNPLLREPLRREDIKPRLLGHWGTCPGLNLVYAHLNRIIKKAPGAPTRAHSPPSVTTDGRPTPPGWWGV